MKYYHYIIISGIAFLIFLHFCDRKPETHSTHTQVDTIYLASKDPIHRLPVKEYIPYKVEVPGQTKFYPIPTVIDSSAVVKDYFSRRSYQDSTGNDSVKVYFSANTFKNELMDLQFKYRLTIPTKVIKESKTIDRQLLFVGIDMQSNGNNLSFYPGFYFDIDKGMLGAGYDPLNKSIKIGFYGKLKLWNRR